MILDFEINNIKYDYRVNAPGADGVYQLDAVNRTYVPVETVTLEIQAEVDRLLAIDASTQYQRDRATAYPSLQDQADMQFHDLANGTTTWLDAIQAVKDAYPKPKPI